MSSKHVEKIRAIYEGAGEVRKFTFQQCMEAENAYIYAVNDKGKIHYEVFVKKTAPLCVDFEKRIYSETHFREVYPKANDFGVWAWTYRDKESALKKFETLKQTTK
jgi:hypothetical protein